MSTTQKRISEKDLQSLVDTINEITESPLTQIGENGWNVGNYHLAFAYGGVNLHRVVNDSGGVTCPIMSGYYTKRELHTMLVSFIYGLTSQKTQKG